MMLVAPAYAGMHKSDTLTTLDIVAAVSFVFFFILEVVADEQQWVC
jgi:steroid 5-alpha reductase family enzyme